MGRKPETWAMIRVRDETRLKLLGLRGHHGCRSADDVITFLLAEFEETPKRREP